MGKLSFEESLRKYKVDEEIIRSIIDVPYEKDENRRQEAANFEYAALKKCDELLDFDILCKVRCERSCSTTGSVLLQSKQFAKDNSSKSLEEKIALLQHIPKPVFIDQYRLEGLICGKFDVCPCTCLRGCTPKEDVMPLSYCLCCAGFLKFHYEKSLGIKLRIEKMVSSILNSKGTQPCVAIYEIL